MERTCIKCGQEMQPIKNGFLFLSGTEVRTSDLWGCRTCKRFQIHGTNKNVAFEVGILKDGSSALITDPGNPSFDAIVDPELIMPSDFSKHMKEWYPNWHWKEN